jgi:hypothetical protein
MHATKTGKMPVVGFGVCGVDPSDFATSIMLDIQEYGCDLGSGFIAGNQTVRW